MINILVIEDEVCVASMERDFLEGSGFSPFIANHADKAFEIINSEKIDAIILDVTLPDTDGFSLCRQLREITNIPILLTSSSSNDSDIVRGLGIGADAYLIKPLSGPVLIAHLRAQLAIHDRIMDQKINKISPEEGFTIDNLTIRPKARQVILNGKDVSLTGKEFDLLFFLINHPNEVFTKEDLFEAIWGLNPIGEPATVTVHINRLRDKLKTSSGHPYEYIETVWGSGYRFKLNK